MSDDNGNKPQEDMNALITLDLKRGDLHLMLNLLQNPNALIPGLLVDRVYELKQTFTRILDIKKIGTGDKLDRITEE